jgi:hypothetical protein
VARVTAALRRGEDPLPVVEAYFCRVGHSQKDGDRIDAFWKKVDRSAGPQGHWRWRGNHYRNGYGSCAFRRHSHNAHRIAYLLAGFTIPPGWVVDHLCRTRWCVNPHHLEAVPTRINVLRGVGRSAQNARKTACLRGHPLAGANLYAYPTGRHCRACLRDRDQKRRRAGQTLER